METRLRLFISIFLGVIRRRARGDGSKLLNLRSPFEVNKSSLFVRSVPCIVNEFQFPMILVYSRLIENHLNDH